MKAILHVLAAPFRALVKARMRHAHFQIAGYIQTEYGLGMTKSEIANVIEKEGYDNAIARLTR